MPNFRAKTILITGGTGSFGKTAYERLLEQEFKEVRIFSRDELKQEEMRRQVADPRAKFYIGDTRDAASVDAAMKGVDLVFHAAALKQVPSCEFFPMEAVMTNIVGSHNVVQSAIRHGVEKIVCLSTDKAVYPINTMGMTKALMEKVAQAASRACGDTVVCTVRYGNVMCSRGSVIPLFMKQIRENTPITVTKPNMTRFLLPLRHAIDLVFFAFDHATSGDIFVRKAPASTVGDLVTALKQLFRSDLQVRQIGIRHGEKIFETLATKEELVKAEDLGQYLRVPMDERGLNYDTYFTEGQITPREDPDDYTSHNTERLDVAAVKDLLLTLPEVRAEIAAHRQVHP